MPAIFRRNLADSAVVIFPGPAGVLVKDEIASSLERATRWSDVELEEHSGAYVRDGLAWKLTFHQQTPLAGGIK